LGEDKIASPITSDEEDDIKTKHKSSVFHNIKTEEKEIREDPMNVQMRAP